MEIFYIKQETRRFNIISLYLQNRSRYTYMYVMLIFVYHFYFRSSGHDW